MTRRAEPLTLEHLEALDAPCRRCVFWELDPVSRARLEPGDTTAEKEHWIKTVLREWGPCGQVMMVDGKPVGYATYAPATFVPAVGGFSTGPVSPDAVVLTTVYVERAHARGGLGRMLVQAMARDLVERGTVGAVEAFGDLRGPGLLPQAAGQRCVVPVDFLGRVGFRIHREHLTTPRMRMDLRTTLTWRDEVGAALESLRDVVLPVVRPKKAPSPSPEATRTVRTADVGLRESAADGARLR